MRWDPYVWAEDRDFDDFWHSHLATRDRNLLLILGRGFDPRALVALRRIANLGAKPMVWLMAFDNHLEDSELRRSMTEDNRKGLEDIVGCLLYTSPSPRDRTRSRMPSSA